MEKVKAEAGRRNLKRLAVTNAPKHSKSQRQRHLEPWCSTHHAPSDGDFLYLWVDFVGGEFFGLLDPVFAADSIA